MEDAVESYTSVYSRCIGLNNLREAHVKHCVKLRRVATSINIYHKTKSLNNISPNIDFFPSGEIALLLQKTFSGVLMSPLTTRHPFHDFKSL